MKKKIISLLIVLAMLVAVVPAVFAADDSTITVYFQNNWLWTDVNVHYWGDGFGTEWSGIAMTLVENDGTYDIYSAEIPANVTGIIFNGIKDDGSGNRDQTPNIEGSNIKTGVCYYMTWDGKNSYGTFDYTPPAPPAPAVATGASFADGVLSVTIAENDQAGVSYTYTAQSTGTLTVTVDSLSYKWMDSYTEMDAEGLQYGFGRMYCLTVGDSANYANTATIDVTAGQEVTINLTCGNGYETVAAMSVVETPASSSDDEGTTKDVELVAHDQDGETWTYTAQSTGSLTITVTALAYDWMGEGEYTEATQMDLEMGFSRMYGLLVNGENANSYTATLDVTEGQEVTVQLYSYNGYATKATLSFVEGAGGESGGADDDAGTSSATAIVIESLPFELNVDGNYDTYYVWTATADGKVTVVVPEGGLLSLPNSEYWEEGEEANSYVIEVTEGYALVLNFWTTLTATGTNTVTFVECEVGGGYVEPEDIIYENTHTPDDTFELTVGENETVEYIDVTEEHTAVLGEDGYYHLDSADGPILYVDLDHIYSFAEILNTTSGVNEVSMYNADGVKVVYNAAIQAYLDAADANGYYPLTADLIVFYKDYGNDNWWYNPNFSYLIMAELLPAETNEATGWMYACCYLADENPETGDNSMLSVAIAAAIVSAMAIVALPVAKKHF